MAVQWSKDEINRWVDYHSEITKKLVSQRTALESKLIPVSAYVLISGVEEYRRYPEILEVIEASMPAEEIGSRARFPGSQVHTTSIWALVNVFLLGRQALIGLGVIPMDHEPQRTASVLDFWKRVASSYRGDGYLQAFDAGNVVRPFDPDVIAQLADRCSAIDQDELSRVKRTSATLMNYLFLLNFDTRWSIVDTGPYELPEGRVMLVRNFNEMGQSHLPWSNVAAGLTYSNLTAAFVLEGAEVSVNDWGTSVCRPENCIDAATHFGLFTTDNGRLEAVSADRMNEIAEKAKEATRELYKKVAAMSRRERLNAGAYVYFSGLRPFAEIAGVEKQIDWTTPRDSLDVYEIIEPFEGMNTPPDPERPYYWPFP